MTLSDTQTMILSHAANRVDRLAAPPPKLPAVARVNVARALLKVGLMVQVEQPQDPDTELTWTLDGKQIALRITGAGMRAIAVELGGDPPAMGGDG
ncbi:hypothetical protein ACQW02_12690 [Humitalea sp. 24SJ18S-53]|uniref:hypothetical protein n=1 Tax=Humitalea sp. 24SJ18S-53 TaxID=3422307 RepID=UPI003D663BF1